MKRKVLTLYWDNSIGVTSIKIFRELFGIENLDFYQDSIRFLEEEYEKGNKGLTEYSFIKSKINKKK